MVLKLFPLGCAAFILAACGTLPASGPSVSDVESGVTDDEVSNYLLVNVDGRSIDQLAANTDPGLFARFGDDAPAPDLRIGVGDAVAVTIYEVGPGGLFSGGAGAAAGAAAPTGSSQSTLPAQIVSQDGDISVPFAGRVRVAGLTPEAAEAAIRSRLQGQAMQPEVILTVANNVSGTVSVMGEVKAGARITLSIRGDRLLDVLAMAGGVSIPIHEGTIQLTRGGSTVTVPLRTLLDDPRENVYARPGDVVTVSRETRTFVALGASGQNAEIPFVSAKLSLAQALGKTGGLLDERADPEGVFIYRYEPAEVARALDPRSPMPELGQLTPVIYRIDLEDPKGYFYAQRFPMRAGDLIYVSNSPSTSVRKVLSLFQTLATPIGTGASISNSFGN
jgi:polysaccharide export outer membrane protein